ncbi:uncharacterized protein At5g43822 isoform X1 [Telopea speciosissima]|uniref:uncharacterized protein At5g43822 isoform X1 n=1 Tax=Telopea speciosissima TaxID=54955 RepID=UPI001CC51029|nr:uncharacterized protein At5g43822 isoform X1 [Telopea speciosissima]XP_043718996.1 uncharacterized protein At5g43822 isoform X1 [Telopea speciosissima]XP_043718997.1 uncharacterized protein At5g43822 isoform X1 [Telopea speciosissima]XP_043718998.1 uncharacterized protein At5g43822 isoform X1 [Telopea speciosissima]
METVVKKYQQKFRKIRDEINRWDELQSRLLSQFRNASAIIERLQVLQEPKNYGRLTCVNGIREAILGKQMESLQTILISMTKTCEEFHGIVVSLEKILRDGRQQVKGGSMSPGTNQMQLRIGIRPSLADCLEGLRLIHEMYHSEYQLKLSTVSALTLKLSASDVGALHQLLVDQPNIPKEEVKSIFDIILAEEIC